MKASVDLDYPSLLGFPKPEVRGYSRETMIAEKFHAMVELDILNTRMKDFYDVWLLSRHFDFDGARLAEAIEKTFAARKTVVVPKLPVFSPAFAADAAKQAQWISFLKKSRVTNAPETFSDVVGVVTSFLAPVVTALSQRSASGAIWRAGGHWR